MAKRRAAERARTDPMSLPLELSHDDVAPSSEAWPWASENFSAATAARRARCCSSRLVGDDGMSASRASPDEASRRP